MRNSTFRDGVEIAADVIDLDAGTWTREVDGAVVETRPLTADEIDAYTPTPTPNPAADALDELADSADASPLAALRDMADQFRAAATALRSQ